MHRMWHLSLWHSKLLYTCNFWQMLLYHLLQLLGGMSSCFSDRFMPPSLPGSVHVQQHSDPKTCTCHCLHPLLFAGTEQFSLTTVWLQAWSHSHARLYLTWDLLNRYLRWKFLSWHMINLKRESRIVNLAISSGKSPSRTHVFPSQYSLTNVDRTVSRTRAVGQVVCLHVANPKAVVEC